MIQIINSIFNDFLVINILLIIAKIANCNGRGLLDSQFSPLCMKYLAVIWDILIFLFKKW